jgi:hypothetical protein
LPAAISAARRRLRYDLMLVVMVLICGLLLVWIADLSHLTGLLVVAALGLSGALWLVWRVRRVLGGALALVRSGGGDGPQPQ